jgi:hypothetical protein
LETLPSNAMGADSIFGAHFVADFCELFPHW